MYSAQGRPAEKRRSLQATTKPGGEGRRQALKLLQEKKRT
jgi:hypothetical protein